MKKFLIAAGAVLIIAILALPRFRDREVKELNAEERAKLGETFVELEDGFVHYELGGPEDGPPVVLVHGFSTPYFGYDPTFQALTEAGFRVLRFDLFGRGYSDRPDIEYDLELFDRQVAGLVTALDFPKPFALMGWSMGGIIVTEYVCRHPADVDRLIVMDTAGFPIEMPASAKLIGIPIIGDYLFRVIGDNAMIDGCDGNFHRPENFPEFREKFILQLQYKGYKRALLSSLRNMPMADHRAAFEKAGSHPRPVLLIWGKQDTVTPFANHTDVLETLPNATLLAVDQAGHGPHYEQREVVNPILIEFLQSKIDTEAPSPK